ncbi:MAG: 2-oxoacid:acceptor oxidoreductase family protein [Candidatus Omnitrophica bacterium]|nr:2-oxoacid:acceptor oxidoreductase family protein [Candidatus Omnitrophota bacterium]
MKQEIIISGFGGQGVMFAGTLLCHAAMKEGKFVTSFPSYGAEIRGGIANCQVIISDEPIGAPVVYSPGVLIALNEPSFEKFSSRVKKGGFILANTSLYKPAKLSGIKIFEIPANEIAEKSGSILSVNIVMLGSLIAKTKLLKLESVINSIPEVLTDKKKPLWEPNKKALKAGFSYKPA